MKILAQPTLGDLKALAVRYLSISQDAHESAVQRLEQMLAGVPSLSAWAVLDRAARDTEHLSLGASQSRLHAMGNHMRDDLSNAGITVERRELLSEWTEDMGYYPAPAETDAPVDVKVEAIIDEFWRNVTKYQNDYQVTASLVKSMEKKINEMTELLKDVLDNI